MTLIDVDLTLSHDDQLCFTGRSLNADQFVCVETDAIIEPDYIHALLEGNLAGYLVKNFLSSQEAQQIADNFAKSPHKTPRYGEGLDGVEAYIVGASHIEKSTAEYLEQVERSAVYVTELYEHTVNPMAKFREEFISRSTRIKSGRPAQHLGMSAGDSKAVIWNNMSEFLLLPHDDLAQLRDPNQHGFEIQQAIRVIAANYYPIAPKQGGHLVICNIEPDDSTRAHLGLVHSGYPYPIEVLERFENLIIPVAANDLCIINGNLVHAVHRGEATTPSSRLLITNFMTALNDTLIWWT